MIIQKPKANIEINIMKEDRNDLKKIEYAYCGRIEVGRTDIMPNRHRAMLDLDHGTTGDQTNGPQATRSHKRFVLCLSRSVATS